MLFTMLHNITIKFWLEWQQSFGCSVAEWPLWWSVHNITGLLQLWPVTGCFWVTIRDYGVVSGLVFMSMYGHVYLIVVSCAEEDVVGGWVPLNEAHSAAVTLKLLPRYCKVLKHTMRRDFPHFYLETHTRPVVEWYLVHLLGCCHFRIQRNKSSLNLFLITVLDKWGDKTRIVRVSQNFYKPTIKKRAPSQLNISSFPFLFLCAEICSVSQPGQSWGMCGITVDIFSKVERQGSKISLLLHAHIPEKMRTS